MILSLNMKSVSFLVALLSVLTTGWCASYGQ